MVKYNSSGTKQLGTSSRDYVIGVSTDSSGKVYVGGSTFGGLDGNLRAGEYDLFVVNTTLMAINNNMFQSVSNILICDQSPETDLWGPAYLFSDFWIILGFIHFRNSTADFPK